MIERVDERGSEEKLELEGTPDEFSKWCRKSKIQYTRALLLKLTEADVCRKLPSDFDLLILRQLDGGSDVNAVLGHRGIAGNPFDHGLLPTNTWNMAFPGERLDNHLHRRSKEGHLQTYCSLERKDLSQLLPQKLEKNAVVEHNEIPKGDLFLLSKTENPYRPPHLNKKIPPPCDPEVDSLGVSDHKDSADEIIEYFKAVSDVAPAGANILTKESHGEYEAFRRNNPGNEVNESAEPLDECEEFWQENKGNVVTAANKSLGCLMEDNHPTFDDFWAEILETIHLHQEPNTSPMSSHSDDKVGIQFPDEILEITNMQQQPNTSHVNEHSDSEAEIHFPDEESLTSVDSWLLPENLNSLNLDEINLPDEDSLISMDDLIGPDLRNNSKSAYATELHDRFKRLHCEAQSSHDFSVLTTHGHVHHYLPHNQCAQTGFLPLLPNSNILPCLLFCPEISLPSPKTKSSVSHYSLLNQPNISPQLPLPDHPLLGATWSNPKNRMAVYDVDAMLRSTS